MKEGLENIVLGAQIAGRNIRFTYDLSLVNEGQMAWVKVLIETLNNQVQNYCEKVGDVGLTMGNLLMLRVKIGTVQMDECHP